MQVAEKLSGNVPNFQPVSSAAVLRGGQPLHHSPLWFAGCQKAVLYAWTGRLHMCTQAKAARQTLVAHTHNVLHLNSFGTVPADPQPLETKHVRY